MKNSIIKFLFVFFLFSLAFIACSKDKSDLAFEYEYVNQKEGIELLLEEDLHTQNWTDFDIQSRVGDQEATKEDLFQYITKQVLPWSKKEKRKIDKAVRKFANELHHENYSIPDLETVHFVKTTCLEEGDAWAYTRGNSIVFSNKSLHMDKNSLARLVAHEIMHIITRNNPAWREELYRVYDFTIGDKMMLPERYDKFRISNPDTPFYDAYIDYKVNGEEKRLTFCLFSEEPYTGGSFFDYATIVLVELDKETDEPVVIDGFLSYYLLEELPELQEKLSENTDYIIDPEEILAENFVSAVFDEPIFNQTIIENLEKSLKKLTEK